MSDLTKSQIDKLGDRLREGTESEDDLRLLDEFRTSFRNALEVVINKLHELESLKPVIRSAKSQQSIVAKLRRQPVRLSRIQDIAGCRVVVGGPVPQDQLLDILRMWFPGSVNKVFDRRIRPSNGYRAVHFVADIEGKAVEIQIRTLFQHSWAELSEKASDLVDAEIKYGKGPKVWMEILSDLSSLIASHEEQLIRHELLKNKRNDLLAARSAASRVEGQVDAVKEAERSLEEVMKLIEEGRRTLDAERIQIEARYNDAKTLLPGSPEVPK